MTHEADFPDEMNEEDWQLYCENHAKETHGQEEGTDPQTQEEEDVPPQV